MAPVHNETQTTSTYQRERKKCMKFFSGLPALQLRYFWNWPNQRYQFSLYFLRLCLCCTLHKLFVKIFLLEHLVVTCTFATVAVLQFASMSRQHLIDWLLGLPPSLWTVGSETSLFLRSLPTHMCTTHRGYATSSVSSSKSKNPFKIFVCLELCAN